MRRSLWFAVVGFMISVGSALAFDPGSVLVVVNPSDARSLPTAQYYMDKRGIPYPDNLCTINPGFTYSEWTTCQNYYAIESGIKAWFDAHPGAEDRVRYIVLSKGFPMGVYDGDRAGSVDSALRC